MSATILRVLDATGLESFAPFVRLLRGDDAKEQLRRIGLNFGAPLIALMLFLGAWSAASQSIMTKYGNLPSPGEVWTQAAVLWDAHVEGIAAEELYYESQAVKVAEFTAAAQLLSSQGKDGQAAKMLERAARAGESKVLRLSLLHRSDHRLPQDGLRRVPRCLSDRRPDRSALRHQRVHQGCTQPAHSDLQAGLTTGMAPHCHDLCRGAVHHQTR